MSVEKVKRQGRARLPGALAGGRPQSHRTFTSREDADRWETEVRRRRKLGTLHLLDAGKKTLDAGHDARLTLTRYGHVMDELAPVRGASTQTRRPGTREGSVPAEYPRASSGGD